MRDCSSRGFILRKYRLYRSFVNEKAKESTIWGSLEDFLAKISLSFGQQAAESREEIPLAGGNITRKRNTIEYLMIKKNN